MRAAPSPGVHLSEVARVFLKLGLVGFGGPAAHIAVMEDEVVRRRRWMTREHFLGPLIPRLAAHRWRRPPSTA